MTKGKAALMDSKVFFEILPLIVITTMFTEAAEDEMMGELVVRRSLASLRASAGPTISATSSIKNWLIRKHIFISNLTMFNHAPLKYVLFWNGNRQTMNSVRCHEIAKLKAAT